MPKFEFDNSHADRELIEATIERQMKPLEERMAHNMRVYKAEQHARSNAAPAKTPSCPVDKSINVAPLIDAVSRDSRCRFSVREVCSMLGLPFSTSQVELIKELQTAKKDFDATGTIFFMVPNGEIVFRSKRLDIRSK